jgi:tetratricopeptide (TPR) repeat protein
MTRLRSVCLAAAVSLTLGWLGGGLDAVRAQTPSPPEPADKAPPSGKVDRSRNIDFLFEALKIAPDRETARLVENRIWSLWVASGSDTADLLMNRVKTAIEAKDTELAIRLLDAIVELKPDYTEGWNRRATLYFQKRDYDRAMRDIAQVLTREPRHFGALTGLGMILEDVGQDKQALEVFSRALAIDPHLEKVPDIVKELRARVQGREI